MDATERRIESIALASAKAGEAQCEAEIAGLRVTIHVPPHVRLEGSVTRRQLRSLQPSRVPRAYPFSKS